MEESGNFVSNLLISIIKISQEKLMYKFATELI